MITDIKISSCEDIFAANEVMNFPGAEPLKGAILGGGSWLAKTSSTYDSLLPILRIVNAKIFKELPEYRMWLFAGNTSWQPDTRIVRYRKLWGSLKARGIEITHAANSQEQIIESGNGLKFFGALQISELSIGSVARALTEERCAYLVAISGANNIQDFLAKGWSGNIGEDLSLIDDIVRQDGLIFKQVGEFDDQERGLVGLGKPRLIRLLID